MRNGKKVESVLIIYGNVRLVSRFREEEGLKEFAREKFTNERVREKY